MDVIESCKQSKHVRSKALRDRSNFGRSPPEKHRPGRRNQRAGSKRGQQSLGIRASFSLASNLLKCSISNREAE